MHEHLTVTLHWVLAVCPHNHSLKQGIQVYFGPDIAFFFHWFNAYSRLGYFWCHGFHLLVALRIESSSFNTVAVSYTVLIKFRGPNVKQARHCIIQIHWHERCLTEIIYFAFFLPRCNVHASFALLHIGRFPSNNARLLVELPRRWLLFPAALCIPVGIEEHMSLRRLQKGRVPRSKCHECSRLSVFDSTRQKESIFEAFLGKVLLFRVPSSLS